MASREDSDNDDDFSDLYKEYTGPPRTIKNETTNANKRSQAGSDEEEGSRDPNAVPTDFTSREAKVWEAKSKATERNWKKRKEEEMICKICGESGHFTQGCPSTLGANRKSQDFFERVPARDPQVKALFSEKVISKIEKDIGCKLKMEEKFLIVSGKDRLILAKGVDAVHKIKNEGVNTSMSSRSRSPPPPAAAPERRSPVVSSSRLGRSDSQRSNPNHSPRPYYNQRFSSRQEKMTEDLHRLPRGSPQAYGNGGRSTSLSKSPGGPPPPPHHPSYTAPHHTSYGDDADDRNRAVQRNKNKGWDDLQSSTQTQTLEDLHLEYKRDAMEMTKIRDKEEDEENKRHREAVREMREDYMQRFGMLRANHAKQWEEFLQRRVHQHQHQHMPPHPPAGFGGYNKQEGYHSEYENPYGNPMARYPDVDNYPSSRSQSRDAYGEFQRQDYYNNNNNNNNRY